MAERFEAFRRFDYRLNSNLVIQKETHAPSQNEPTGEPESLVGRLNYPMGDKVVRTTPQELKESLQKKRAAKEASDVSEKYRDGGFLKSRHSVTAAKRFKANIRKGATVLDADVSETSNYVPTTMESSFVYRRLLSEVVTALGDQPEDVLTDASAIVITACRNTDLRDAQKKAECESVLGPLTDEAFMQLYQLSRGLHDFKSNSFGTIADASGSTGDTSAAEVSGVAVVFDEEDDLDIGMGGDDVEDEVIAEKDEDDDDETVLGKRLGEDEEEKFLEAKYSSDVDSNDEEDGSAAPAREGANDVLNVRTIDPHWLQRELGKLFPDAELAVQTEREILKALTLPDLQECENRLVYILKYDNFSFAKLVLNNRWKVYYCTRLGQAQSQEEKNQILEEMRGSSQGQEVLDQLETVKLRVNKEKEFARNVRREAATLAERSAAAAAEQDADEEELFRRDRRTLVLDHEKRRMAVSGSGKSVYAGESGPGESFSSVGFKPTSFLDIESMAFTEGAHVMANPVVKLQDNAQRLEKKAYDEVVIPAAKRPDSALDEQMNGKPLRLPISDLPQWAQEPFTAVGIQKLNPAQTTVYPVAFEQPDKNMLICAPTGAGKTNIAVLSILGLINQYRDPETGIIDKRAFKVVYVSPMKALVMEQVAGLQKRFECYGLRVEELTGDVNLSRQQIENTQIIVTTPEKWDIITRRAGERAYVQLVKLVIIDEIHLLHDSRGPVLEALTARTLRQIEATQEHVRLVGLSATLPNYQDVAIFLRVSLKEGEGLFVFGPHHRPVPLMQTYIGLKEKKAIKRLATMNRVTYEKVLENAGRNQVLVFVHSRRETVKTARMLRQMAMEEETLARFLEEDSASREILQTEADALKREELKDLLPFGFAVHHAGLPRTDRRLVEDLFADRHIQVLVSTATLAWGVNLPAHTVIIKGTQVYSPEQGKWTELSPLDVMQMMGRAGRPQYDSTGHGIIITNHSELQFYLSLNNQQLPIESQLLSMLPDIVNAEITLGTLSSRRDVVQWLGYTYFFVRLLRNPTLYGFPADIVDSNDPMLEQVRTDIAHSALLLLDKHQLIRYDKRLGTIQPTPLGRVASHYYIRYPSIAVYNEHLRPSFSDVELLRLFSLSHEFRYIPVRQEEKVELSKLIERVPIPVKGGSAAGVIEETSTKVNVLLQAYISQLKLEGFALAADMTYIQQSAARVMRALFEINLKRGWAALANRTLLFYKMVTRRMWSIMSPLRQFKQVLPEDILRKLEKKDFPWERYFDLSSTELGELVRVPKLGKTLHRLIHTIPAVELSAFVQPLTRSTLLVELTVTPDFRWDPKFHDAAGEGFWILVEDGDGEVILHHEYMLLKEYQVAQDGFELTLEFAVPVTEPLPPNYFLRCVSDKWLQSETVLLVSFKNLILPEKNIPPTELLNLQPLPVAALRYPDAEGLYSDRDPRSFEPIETQVFSALYNTDDNILICAPPAPTGLRTCAEFAILRMTQTESIKRCVYLVPYEACAQRRYKEWKERFSTLHLKVCLLTGDVTVDLKLIADSHVIISTPEHWDFVSRRWRTRRGLQQIRLFIVDELQLLDSSVGSVMEVCVSRMRYISAQLPHPIRIVGLAVSLANAQDVAEWFAVPQTGLFNFPNTRPNVKMVVESYDVHHRASRLMAMSRPTFQWIVRCCATTRNAIVFCPDRKQARIAAADLLLQAAAHDAPKVFLHISDDKIAQATQGLPEKSLQQALAFGVGYLHEGFPTEVVDRVVQLYESGAIQVLVVTQPLAWSLNITAHLVIIQDTMRYDAKQKRWESYPIVDVMGMSSRVQPAARIEAAAPSSPATVVVMCPSSKKELYSKFKSESIPIESRLDQWLTDHINAEVTLKTITSKQDAVDWLTWTFYYRRLSKNPNYYGLQGVTHAHLSEHLSEVVENAVETLASGQCVAVDPEDGMTLTELNLGLVAAFYYVRHATIELLNRSVNAKTKRRGLIEVICAVTELGETVPVRFGEEDTLKKLASELDLRLHKTNAAPGHQSTAIDVNDPHIKSLILLYAHFHRAALTNDLMLDQVIVLQQCIRVVQAFVDVISSNGWLTPALLTMELSQMIVQALHPSRSVLYQLPHMDASRIALAKEHNVTDIFELINVEDDVRNKILAGLTPRQVEEIADACNRYPVLNVEYDMVTSNNEDIKPTVTKGDEASEDTKRIFTVASGASATLIVRLERVTSDQDDAEDEKKEASGAALKSSDQYVIAPYFPRQKEEQWWVVLGYPRRNNLLAIKRISTNNRQNASVVKLDFDAPEEEGDCPLTLSLICDSYMGCDQEYEIFMRTVS